MKFSQMQYKRPEFAETNAKYKELLENFKAAKTADECFAAYKEINDFNVIVESMFTIAYIRKTLDTRDEFYAAEIEYIDEVEPELEEVLQEIVKALLESPFREDMEAKWGKLMFTNLEIDLKTFSPEIIEDLQEENRLCSEYSDLMASAMIEFDGKQLNLSEIDAYFQNTNSEVRKVAATLYSNWFMERNEQFDNLFDALVKVRTHIAKKLGYKSFTELGYYRMQRNCYDENTIAQFRERILEHFVPVVTRLKSMQADRIGTESISIIDNDFCYSDGNPTPKGTPDEIFEHGKQMYKELSKETSEFFNFMLENELFDVLSRPGKEVGGYQSMISMHKAPFIFANFNGTSGDIDVLTHEAGHAYAAYVARDIYPVELQFGQEDIGEIHSMSMEFFAWPWMEGFFGEDTEKYYHSHLSTSVTFLPYGVMVDDFQHQIYANPNMTAKERNDLWLSLEAKYRPWLDMAGIPFWAEGRRWQAQTHIYCDPFYYIDYCLAGVIALDFWTINEYDTVEAWSLYNKLVHNAATKTFVDVIEDSYLSSPFDTDNLRRIAREVYGWLFEWEDPKDPKRPLPRRLMMR
ncbi:MAG: M3 family oligoendopeptidase [Defluviitaleaceae bacterium]|nr:M3 family oligoendopeptidase [Defluviitaleaceae bacterium]